MDRRQRISELGQDRHEEYQEFPDVTGQKIDDGFSYVLKDDPALFYCCDYTCEVVVSQHHVRCAFCNLGACQAHSNSDISGAKGRSVIHPVSQHSDDFVMLLQGVDEPKLVLRRYSCINPDTLCNCLKLSLIHLVKFTSGDNPRTLLEHAELLSDCLGSVGIITCHHNRSDTGFL